MPLSFDSSPFRLRLSPLPRHRQRSGTARAPSGFTFSDRAWEPFLCTAQAAAAPQRVKV